MCLQTVRNECTRISDAKSITCFTVFVWVSGKTAEADPGFLERVFVCIKAFAVLICLIFLKCPMKIK